MRWIRKVPEICDALQKAIIAVFLLIMLALLCLGILKTGLESHGLLSTTAAHK